MRSLGSSTVLVVDDERNMRDMLEIGLTQHGFIVTSAPGGVEALALLKTMKPDIIVLDVMMPKIDGISLLPLIRRLTESPIVMLSARSDAQDKIAGLLAGAEDYVATREVETSLGPIALTAREFDLLATLLREPGRVFTRRQLLDAVWGSDTAVEPNIVETYVSYLRGKLGDRGAKPLIRTIRRVGYTARID